jgi:transcriptional regulator with XRE-family HTH domain
MPPDVCIQLGERIRELRKERGWRQIDLAEQAGIHEVHISDLERGAREVGLRHLAALAAAFDLSLSEFLKGIKGR